MNEEKTLEIINYIFKMIFDTENPFTLEEVLNKMAFDIKLPQQVHDSTNNEVTWTDSINSNQYITQKNMEEIEQKTGWLQPKAEITGLQDLIEHWKKINLTTTERVYDSECVSKSDTIYRCENIYHSTNCNDSKNLIFCDSCAKSEYAIASQRSILLNNCIRCDDSNGISNSYNVICSGQISNCFFIQDCYDLHDCMFCSHINGQKYCIANMQFTKEEYDEIRKVIVKWILNK
ncbi:MAG: hypothetical protein K2M17_02695 [Bacilli bacterium]|nr:hypothetical protein [Bacilli bacterium]